MGLGDTINKLTRKALWDDTLVPGLKVTEPATVRLVTADGAFNPATGAVSAPTTSDMAVRVLVSRYSAWQIAQSGGIIGAGDIEVTIYADASLDGLNRKALLIYQGKTWKIAEIRQDILNDAKFLYVCRATS
jgi:hypothetical protein